MGVTYETQRKLTFILTMHAYILVSPKSALELFMKLDSISYHSKTKYLMGVTYETQRKLTFILTMHA
jgi:hypothetical protein